MARTMLLLLGAFVAGFLGSLASPQSPAVSVPVDVIRASRIELVNGRGVIVGAWEATSGGSRLRFFSPRGAMSLEIGADADGRPHLQMNGQDGRERVIVALNSAEKPLFGMSDERWMGRVVLGFLQPDFPDPELDKWGLVFRAFGSEHAVSSIGASKRGSAPTEGFLTVSGKSVR